MNKTNGNISDLIKSGAILVVITTILLLTGFISNMATNRVEGLPRIYSSINSYVESGAYFIMQTIQAIFYFPLEFKYLNVDIDLIIGIVPVLLLIALISIFFEKFYQKHSVHFKIILLVILLISYTSFFVKLYQPFFSVHSVLQPTEQQQTIDLINAKENKFAYSHKIISKYYKEKFKECETENSVRCLFSMRISINSLDKNNTYITLVQLSILSIIFFFAFIKFFDPPEVQYINKIAILMVSLQIFTVPYIHGVIGVKYEYPVVSLALNNDNNSNKTDYKGIILLKENNVRLYFLDRQNYMSIYHIDRSNIKFIEQLAIMSLIQNCAQNSKKVALCEEVYW